MRRFLKAKAGYLPCKQLRGVAQNIIRIRILKPNTLNAFAATPGSAGPQIAAEYNTEIAADMHPEIIGGVG